MQIVPNFFIIFIICFQLGEETVCTGIIKRSSWNIVFDRFSAILRGLSVHQVHPEKTWILQCFNYYFKNVDKIVCPGITRRSSWKNDFNCFWPLWKWLTKHQVHPKILTRKFFWKVFFIEKLRNFGRKKITKLNSSNIKKLYFIVLLPWKRHFEKSFIYLNRSDFGIYYILHYKYNTSFFVCVSMITKNIIEDA